jgi:hypothetical protein
VSPSINEETSSHEAKGKTIVDCRLFEYVVTSFKSFVIDDKEELPGNWKSTHLLLPFTIKNQTEQHDTANRSIEQQSPTIIILVFSGPFHVIDFVGYMKNYSLINDPSNENKTRSDRRRTSFTSLTSFDVTNAIGTDPTTCLFAMGNLSQRLDKGETMNETVPSMERMFLCKLNPDGQFTYFDQMYVEDFVLVCLFLFALGMTSRKAN